RIFCCPGGTVPSRQIGATGLVTRCGLFRLERFRGLSGGAGEFVTVLVEQSMNPVDYRSYACSATQIVVHDDPIFGSELRHRWGYALEQRVGVARVTRQ